jgi:hypothetical protein
MHPNEIRLLSLTSAACVPTASKSKDDISPSKVAEKLSMLVKKEKRENCETQEKVKKRMLKKSLMGF